MQYRCPKHDLLFESLTDHRPPDSNAKGAFARHPIHGHPDCPKCEEETAANLQQETVAASGVARTRVSNRRAA
jgi:hypothetical protein